MTNPVGDFANLPKPIQAVAVLGAGGGVTSVVMMFMNPQSGFWKVVVIGIVCVVARR